MQDIHKCWIQYEYNEEMGKLMKHKNLEMNGQENVNQ